LYLLVPRTRGKSERAQDVVIYIEVF